MRTLSEDPVRTLSEDPVRTLSEDPVRTLSEDTVCRVDELAPGEMKMARVGDRRVLVACTDDGFAAIDNACPHQGYGLVTGTLDGDLVTCQWHNWKFRVSDGRCVIGEEDVESHPIAIRGDEVWVTVTEPDDEERRSRLWSSLDRGILADYRGQIARDAARLLDAGANPVDMVWRGVVLGAPRNDWGMGHEMANAADCLAVVELYDGLERTLPIAQALSGIAEQCRDRRVYQPPSPSLAEDIHAAIESEECEVAVASVRAMLSDGAPMEEVRALFVESVGRHHLSYGHGAIYVQKAFELIDRAGWERSDDLLPHLMRTLIYMTREDTLPYMSNAMGSIESADLSAMVSAPDRVDTWEGPAALVDLLLGAEEAPIDQVVEAVVGGAGVEGLLDAVSLAVSERLLRHDASHEFDDDRRFGWLDISHGLTYSRAARWAWHSHRGVDSARLALFAAFLCFDTGRLERRSGVAVPVVPDHVVETPDIAGAVVAGDEAGAVTAASRGSIDEVGATLARLALQDAAGSFIVAAHLVKSVLAAWEEASTTGSNLPLMAVARLAAGPRSERFVARNVSEAVAFVRTGQPPLR